MCSNRWIPKGLALVLAVTTLAHAGPRHDKLGGFIDADGARDVPVQLIVPVGNTSNEAVTDIISWNDNLVPARRVGKYLPHQFLRAGTNFLQLAPGRYTISAWSPKWLMMPPGGLQSDEVELTVPSAPTPITEVVLQLHELMGVVVVVNFKHAPESSIFSRVTLLPVTDQLTSNTTPVVVDAPKDVHWDIVTEENPIHVYQCHKTGAVLPAFQVEKRSDTIAGPIVNVEEGKVKYVVMDVD
jgi:hypothetical protein